MEPRVSTVREPGERDPPGARAGAPDRAPRTWHGKWQLQLHPRKPQTKLTPPPTVHRRVV